MDGKIALEEHFVTPELEGCITSVGWDPDEWRGVLDQLEDLEGERIEEMDRVGIEMAVLSLGSDGIQGIADADRAVETASGANDALAQLVARRPERFSAFGAVALQDPDAAAEEAERAVLELGFKGLLVNGYSDLDDGAVRYYDEPETISGGSTRVERSSWDPPGRSPSRRGLMPCV